MAAATAKEGVIDANSLYTLNEIQARLGLGKAALRAARNEGLVVKRIGRRGYVRGSDILDWYDKNAQQLINSNRPSGRKNAARHATNMNGPQNGVTKGWKQSVPRINSGRKTYQY